MNNYGGPFWSKLNKIFSLLIELFALAVYFILLYIYILLPFVAPFFRYLPWIFGTSYKLFFLQCTDYFCHPFWIIFFVLSEWFLVTLHQLFLATVNLIFWFRDALRDLDMFFPSLWEHGGICANSNCTNSSKSNSRNRPNSANSPHKWAILQQC